MAYKYMQGDIIIFKIAYICVEDKQSAAYPLCCQALSLFFKRFSQQRNERRKIKTTSLSGGFDFKKY